jgi:excisionase family DNA binding protein
MEHPQFLSPEEFAKVFKIGLKTVYRRLWAGQLPAYQDGGRKKLWRIDLNAYLMRLSHPTPTATASSADQSGEAAVRPTDERISGPPPKWKRAEFSFNNKRGYGPKKKKHQS